MKFLIHLSIFFFSLFQLSFASYEITIITSVFKGGKYIEHFLREISKQSIYDQCEHILIDPSSNDGEEAYITDFALNHPNVVYIKLDKDPGLYGVWNLAIKRATGSFIINANLDDTFDPLAFEFLYNQIKKDPSLDLVYTDAYVTSKPNQVFGKHEYDLTYTAPDFSLESLAQGCFMGSHPMWRKTMHKRYGFFDEKFKCAGDWEMWLRAASKGAKFKHFTKKTGLNYNGPQTLSNSQAYSNQRKWEQEILKKTYNAKTSKMHIELSK